MEINLNNEVIQESLNKMVDKATQAAFSDWQVSNTIEKVVAEKVVGEILNKSMEEAVQKIDTVELTNILAAEIQRVMTKCVCSIFREVGIDIVYIIRRKGLREYMTSDDEAKLKAKIAAEFDGKLERQGDAS